mmetsp:Transcript_3570/g.4103  ORF Transcript_3570/g.4103 Transcript_3570/m.4103 type:complete len:368 (-) Transcript_3570:72-1175(-)
MNFYIPSNGSNEENENERTSEGKQHLNEANFVPSACLRGHIGPIHAVMFTADNKYCITCGNDRSVRLFNPTRLDPAETTREAQMNISSSTLNRNRSRIVTELPSSLPIKIYPTIHPYAISCIATDPKSQILLSCGGKTMACVDVITGKTLGKYHGHQGRINTVTCNEDGNVYLTGSYDGSVKLWDGRSSHSEIQTLNESKDSIMTVLSVNHLIVSGGVDGCIRTYDVRRGQMRVDTVHESITGMSLSGDAKCIAASCLDGGIRLLEHSTGDLLNTYWGSHVSGKYGLECTFTKDDLHVVSGSEDGNVVLYNLVSGKCDGILGGHTRPTCSIACGGGKQSSTKEVIVSGSYDGNAVVWASPEESYRWA